MGTTGTLLFKVGSRRCRKLSTGYRALAGIVALSALLTLLPALYYSQSRSLTSHLRSSRLSFVRQPDSFQHFLSACVIIRESSDLLPEFLIRNFAAGVDHFFLYGDDSNPNEIARLRQIFARLKGIVTYIPHGRSAPEDAEDPETYVQMRMYRHCLQRYGNTSNWVALIDTDEFFETFSLPFTHDDGETLPQRAFLHDVLAAHQMFPILCVRWKTALTNGRLLPQRKGETLDDLFPKTCRVQVNNKDKLALRKAVLQPRYLDFEESPKLDVAIHKGFKFKGEKKRLHCVWGLAHDLEPPIHLVHYWSRDLSSYLRKIRRGRPRKGIPPRTLTDLFLRESLCELEENSGSSELRRKYLSGLVRKMPFLDTPKDSFPTAEEAIGAPDNSTFSFCKTRVAKFISKISAGIDFSDEAYCEHRSSAACCLLQDGGTSSWPFPWAEYLMDCGEYSNEDNFFK